MYLLHTERFHVRINPPSTLGGEQGTFWFLIGYSDL